MNDSLAQHSAQTPSPSTGSRQATHSVGSAMSSASFAACDHAPRHAFSAPRTWVEMDRDGETSAAMGTRLAFGCVGLKRQRIYNCGSPAINLSVLYGYGNRRSGGCV